MRKIKVRIPLRCSAKVRQLTHGLTNETVETETAHEVKIKLLTSSEELGADVEIGVDPPGRIEEVLADVNGGRVGIVEAESIEHAGELLDVLLHVIPEPRAVLGLVAVAKLDAVAPDDEVAADVGARGGAGKVLERVGVPDPAVVGEGEGTRVLLLGEGVGRKASEEGFDEGTPARRWRSAAVPR